MDSVLAASTICRVIAMSSREGVGIAARVVVRQDQGRRLQFQRAPHHLARVDGRVVDGAARLRLVGQQAVLVVEEQDAELLHASRAP